MVAQSQSVSLVQKKTVLVATSTVAVIVAATAAASVNEAGNLQRN
jgi:hypothetical protein